MITLITFRPAFDEPSASPFCTKAIWLLNMAGVSWSRRDVDDPRPYPRAKLPAVDVDGQVIPDSDNIRAYLESLGHDFDAGLSDLDRATSRAFIRMAEEHMYFHIVLDRWGDDTVWPIVRDTYFHAIPKLLRGLVTRKLRRACLQGMDRHGLGRLTPQERLDKLEPDLQAITTRLWHGCFLFGDRPTAADASVAAMLSNMMATPGQTLLRARITGDDVLRGYVDRMKAAMRNPNSAVVSLCA